MGVMMGAKYTEAPASRVGEYIADPTWVMQQKIDGVRAMIHTYADGRPTEFRGVTGEPIKFAAAAQHFPKLSRYFTGERFGTAVIDGELLIERGEFWAFDLPYSAPEGIGPSTPYAERAAALVTLDLPQTLPLALLPDDKRSLWNRVVETNGEGVIVKRIDAAYPIGKRTDVIRKIKIVRTVDVIVTKVDRPDPRHGSFSLAVKDGSGNLVPVGACSAIGKPATEVGEVVEIRFAKWGGGALVQPRMVRKRPDKAPEECGLDQLPTDYSYDVLKV